MLAYFSIYLLDTSPVTQNPAGVLGVLQNTGLEFQPGPMGTRVEGDWEEVMSAIRRCHLHLSEEHRVLTTILIDDDQSMDSITKEHESCKAFS